MSYTYKQCFDACLDYFNGDTLAANVFVTKYPLRQGEEFYELTPDDMHKNRLAPEWARIEQNYPNPLSEEEVYEAIRDYGPVIPQGSPSFAIGNNLQMASAANCFFIGSPEDSYGGILKLDQEVVQVCKRRGGAGIAISTIRPKKSVVNNSALTSDGIGVFIKRFSNSTSEVAQNGRRGALIEILNCRHPEIETFINIKRDLKEVQGANISIQWTDDFLEAVENDDEYILRFPCDVEPEEADITKTVRAKDIWNQFIEATWESAEPGALFWDTVLNQSVSDCYADGGFRTEGTNPCAELVLSRRSSCLLMANNLTCFVDSPFTDNASFNWERFDKYVRMITRMSDDLVDLEVEKLDKIIAKIESDPEPEDVKSIELNLWKDIKNTHLKGRRIGIGDLGLADMLAMLGYKYGSDESIEFADRLYTEKQRIVYDETAELAKERGSFPVWDWEKEKDSHYIKRLPKETQEKIKKYGRRNIACMTIAPTGSIALLAQTSGGGEPVYEVKSNRNKKLSQSEIDAGEKPDFIDDSGVPWKSFETYHEGYRKWMEVTGKTEKDESPYDGCTSMDLDWMHRVKLQGVINQSVDHSISSTVNLPKHVTQEEVSQIYLEAWKQKCKGLTIYRKGSRKGVLGNDEIEESNAPKRPEKLPCDIHFSNITDKKTGKVSQWVFLVGKMEGVPYEIFGGKKEAVDIPRRYKTGNVVKNGRNDKGIKTYNLELCNEEGDVEDVVKDIASAFSANPGSYTRIVSAMLRHGVPSNVVCDQLLKDSDEADMWSFEKGVSRVLRKYVKEGSSSKGICMECGKESLIYSGGCVLCSECGWTKCS